MPLQATSGAASYDAFGGGVPVVPQYIEDVFSTYLYTGNGATYDTIINGVDLSGKGGLVWTKSRSAAEDHRLEDTVRGAGNKISSNLTAAQTAGGVVGQFNNNGFTVFGNTSVTYASWTLREQPKFFDIVTWTGDDVSNRVISHSLGSTPGCIIVKRLTTNGANWVVWHRSLTSSTYSMYLDLTDAQANNGWIKDQTSTTFTVDDKGNELVNQSGKAYVAYLFAHDAGGFGLTGTDNVISCGSYTGNGSATGPVVTLGYEPQWLLIKAASGTGNWYLLDNMRGIFVESADPRIFANTSAAENFSFVCSPTATGFQVEDGFLNGSGTTYIYIAIRRGPMKVPTVGTSVFTPIATTPTAGSSFATNFPFDASLLGYRAGDDGGNWTFIDRLRGYAIASTDTQPVLRTSSTAAEFGAGTIVYNTNNTGGLWGSGYAGLSDIFYFLRRSPSFFDEVCYTGTGSVTNYSHNLSAVPELMIMKKRSANAIWCVYSKTLGVTGNDALFLNLSNPANPDGGVFWNGTAPTSSVFTLGTGGNINGSGSTFVAYLFATCAGVSKVGSYTGNGSTQTIDCGFTGGARFVLIKRTDSAGDWYTYDTARGMTVLTDPYLLLNSTAAETATLGSVTTVSTGFAVNASILAAINTNAASYIFLAIA